MSISPSASSLETQRTTSFRLMNAIAPQNLACDSLCTEEGETSDTVVRNLVLGVFSERIIVQKIILVRSLIREKVPVTGCIKVAMCEGVLGFILVQHYIFSTV